jgi:hypothetical protein
MRCIHNKIDGTAISYFLAYKCLMDKNQDVSNFYHDKLSIYLFPAISLAAFSCELALKAKIYSESRKKPKAHDLNKLFRLLNSHTQHDIIQRTIKLYNDKSKLLLSNDLINKDNFTDLIEEHKNSFVSWRYVHEGVPATDLDFLEVLMFCLNEFDEEFISFVKNIYI